MRTNLLYVLSFFLLLLQSTPAYSSDGFGPLLKSQIENTFFENGRVSSHKVELFRLNVETAQRETYKGLVDYYVHVGQKSLQDAEKKASSASLMKAFARLSAVTEKLKKSEGQASYDLAASALHLGYTVRSEGRWMDYDEIKGYAKGVFKRYQVKRRNANQSEASNLWNASQSRFYTQAELMKIKADGGDVSALNPLGNGTYWNNLDVSGQPMARTYQNSTGLYQGIDFVFPEDGATVDFDEVKRAQSRPKFDVTWNANGKKKKFKLKFLSETHSEVTAATLMSALGFNTDPSRRVNNIRVRFKDGEKAVFHRDLESYYGYWELQQAIVEDGRDAQGDYIVFREALLEGRTDDLIRVGAWSFTQNGHPETREVRAMPIFMVWIANNDMKESGQNKMILRSDSEADKVYFASGDLGWAFGSFMFPETPSWFKWNVVKDVRPDSVSFNYLTWHYSDLFQFTTWDDARWMVRLIARLTRGQIVNAVRAGQWDPSIEKVLIEKLIARRNQLVRTFGLGNEFPDVSFNDTVAPADQHEDALVLFPDGSAGGKGHDKLLDLVQTMSRPVFEYLQPSLMSIQTGIINAALDRAVKPVTEIRLTGDDLAGLGLPFAAGMILRIHRSIVRNEQPKSMNERFLVHDQMVIGWTLGTNLAGVGSSLTYYRSFNLVYPVRQQSEGVFKAAYLPSLLMPYSPGLLKLPNKHSILIEDYVEGRGSLSVSGQAPVVLSAEGSLARVYLKRVLVSDREDKKVNILIDNSHYTELSAKVAAALKVGFVSMNFPFFDGSLRKGSIDRELWSLPADSPESRHRARGALSLVAKSMRTDTLPALASRVEIDADFLMKKWGFNLFGLVTSLDSKTTADVEETDYVQSSETQRKLQIENVSENFWKAPIFDIQERDTVKSFFMGVKSEDGSFNDSVVGLNIRQWDSATTSQELRDDAVVLAQKASADPNFIVFSPALHTNKDQWGAVITMVDVLIYESGVERLLSLSDEHWWKEFTRLTGIVPSNRREGTMLAKDRALLDNFKQFLSSLEKAKRAPNQRRRAEAMTQAMGQTAVAVSLTSGVKGDLVGVVLSQLSVDSYFLSVKISSPIYKQNIFPTEKPLVNRRGVLKFKDARLHDFSLNTISVIYNFFDTLIPVGSTVPSMDYPF
ncbi:MAG: hypothetical protein RLZZ488_571 [Pseudomonadota bacterium]